MKTGIPQRKVPALFCALIIALVLMSFNAPAGQPTHSQAWKTPSGDSILIETRVISRAHKFALYSDESQKVVFFTVRGKQGRVYQLYLFDLDRNLVKQTEIRNRQTTLIKNIDKGVYLFEVFSNDDRIGNGHMTVR